MRAFQEENRPLRQLDQNYLSPQPRWLRDAVVWVAIFAAIWVAWIMMAVLAVGVPGFGLMRFTAPVLWEALCLSAAEAEPLAVFGMWAVMSVAMMLPAFFPALATFRDLGHAGASNQSTSFLLVLGYLSVWFGFSGLAASFQVMLSGWSLVGPDGGSMSHWLTAGLLALAGVYQFSKFKDACLSHCRAPLTFFMERWAPGLSPAFRMGLQMGVYCLGCCWALMLLGFVGGTMNLVWMGIATAFMSMEKLPQIGSYLTKPAGWVLLSGAGVVLLRAVGLF